MLMAAAWVALEDVDPAAGPLTYFVGSHKLPFRSMQDLGCDGPPPSYPCYEGRIREEMEAAAGQGSVFPQSMAPKRGDVIIWAPNLVHGGSSVEDASLTRRSQVTHYFFEGDALYVRPMFSTVTGDVYTSRWSAKGEAPRGVILDARRGT